jgi:hypothetical protein
MIGVWSGWSDKGVLSGTGSRIVRGGSSCPARMGCVKDRRPGIRRGTRSAVSTPVSRGVAAGALGARIFRR